MAFSACSYPVAFFLSGQGQFNFVHVIITPLDYKCNLLTLQCRKGEVQAGQGGTFGLSQV